MDLTTITENSLPPRLFQDLLDALWAGSVAVQARLLLLAPLLHLSLHLHAGLLVLLVPVCKGLLRPFFCLEDTEEVLHAEGIDGFRLVEHVSGAPAVLVLAFNVCRDFRELCKDLLIQGWQGLPSLLRQLFPDLLEHIRLGLAWFLLLRIEECLHAVRFCLHLTARIHVLVHQLVHGLGGDRRQRPLHFRYVSL